MDEEYSKKVWTIKGATLSDKNAMKEYGITKEEIIGGLNEGKLQYKLNHIHGNPYYKLIRKEVENLLKEKYGASFLEKQSTSNRLNQVNTELSKLKRQQKKLTLEKTELELKLNEFDV